MFQTDEPLVEMSSQAEGFTTDLIFDEDLPGFTSTPTQSVSKQNRKKSKFTITGGSLAAHLAAVIHENPLSQGDTSGTKKKSKFVVNETEEEVAVGLQLYGESLEPTGQAKCEVRTFSCEDSFTSPKLKMFHSPDSHSTGSPDSSSPVLTLASSFKDSSSISRGFIIPDNTEPPKQP